MLRFLTYLLISVPAFAREIHWDPLREPGVGGAVTSLAVNPANPHQILAGGDMLGPSVSEDGGNTWHDSFGLGSWECAEATWKPGSTTEVWLGTMGGPYVSRDGGKNWRQKRVGLPAPETYWGYTAPIQKILFVPGKTDRLLAFGGSRREWVNMNPSRSGYGVVWQSSDSGETWTLKSTVAEGADIRSACFAAGSAEVIFVATREHGVFRSLDGGTTWASRNQGLPDRHVDVVTTHPSDPEILWCSLTTGHRSVYKSTDGGESWKWSGEGLCEDPPHNHFYSKISVSPSDPNVLYCADSSWQQIFRSADGGASWSNITEKRMPPAPTALGFQGNWIEIDPRDSGTVYTCNSVHIFKTTDEGGTWKEMSSKPGEQPDTWQGRGFSGYVPTEAAWNPYQPDQLVLMAMDDGKFMTSTDLENWRMHGPTLDNWGGGVDVSFASDGRTLVAAFGQEGWKQEIGISRDNGRSWKRMEVPGEGAILSIHVHPAEISRLWLIRGGKLHHSTDGGANWTHVANEAKDLMEIAVRPSAPDVLYVTGRDGVYLGDKDNRFKKLVSIESAQSNRICLDPSDPEKFWVASWHYNQFHSGIWRYDHGNWKRVRQDIYASDVAVDPKNPECVVYITNHNPGVDVSGATGVWMTENATSEQPLWTQQNKGLPMLRGNCISFNPVKDGHVVVGLNGRGFYHGRIGK